LNLKKLMKTTIKILVAAAVIGVASSSLSANAGVRFGLSIGLPLPVIGVSAPVYVAPAPLYVAPAPVVVAPPAVETMTYVTAPCPGPQYAWVAGYWSVNQYGRVWVPGVWQYRPHAVVVAHFGGGYGYGYDHGHDWRHR
jgi:hypothetical protein